MRTRTRRTINAIDRELVVIELPAHGEEPATKKMALVTEHEMIDLAENAALIGARLREPNEGEREEFTLDYMGKLGATDVQPFRLPAPWGR